MILKLAGIPGNWEQETLSQFLEFYATIHSARIAYDPITWKSKRIGYVEVKQKAKADRLIEAFHGKKLSTGQVLKITRV